LPALVWNRGGWPACVALVVLVQILTAALGWATWEAQSLKLKV
jgi:hypothetical protein